MPEKSKHERLVEFAAALDDPEFTRNTTEVQREQMRAFADQLAKAIVDYGLEVNAESVVAFSLGAGAQAKFDEPKDQMAEIFSVLGMKVPEKPTRGMNNLLLVGLAYLARDILEGAIEP